MNNNMTNNIQNNNNINDLNYKDQFKIRSARNNPNYKESGGVAEFVKINENDQHKNTPISLSVSNEITQSSTMTAEELPDEQIVAKAYKVSSLIIEAQPIRRNNYLIISLVIIIILIVVIVVILLGIFCQNGSCRFNKNDPSSAPTSLRSISSSAVPSSTVLSSAVPSSAVPSDTSTGVVPSSAPISLNCENVTLKNLATGEVLDSDSGGNAYTYDHNGGNHQRWKLCQIDGYYIFENIATSLVLDSNGDGKVYTLSNNGGVFQKWTETASTTEGYVLFVNAGTSRVLDTNVTGHIFATLDMNGGDSQQWMRMDA